MVTNCVDRNKLRLNEWYVYHNCLSGENCMKIPVKRGLADSRSSHYSISTMCLAGTACWQIQRCIQPGDLAFFYPTWSTGDLAVFFRSWRKMEKNGLLYIIQMIKKMLAEKTFCCVKYMVWYYESGYNLILRFCINSILILFFYDFIYGYVEVGIDEAVNLSFVGSGKISPWPHTEAFHWIIILKSMWPASIFLHILARGWTCLYCRYIVLGSLNRSSWQNYTNWSPNVDLQMHQVIRLVLVWGEALRGSWAGCEFCRSQSLSRGLMGETVRHTQKRMWWKVKWYETVDGSRSFTCNVSEKSARGVRVTTKFNWLSGLDIHQQNYPEGTFRDM